jgi:hypothetical protein
MPLFKCEQCDSIENTALCNYWTRLSHGAALLCSACDPEIGAWHDAFEQKSGEGFPVGEDGFILRQTSDR